ncbi:MAG: PRC-barrel domain-containing protein [Chelatococcus sp.]|uniref:PRC-barrel domain-containing protein n=1 Tax=unclassified Chelatococcus TaxID=2638111 RepID=UPI001BCD74A9|nr:MULTISPECIES: PRC-barrel domain-containing protein [unclassified Chelatococcus]CAH1653874.1 putative Sporulation protein YlmC with PRC-barrel domain [Hyphomicrobiales bacterium]MBS7742851.1 PRC-barrel domain-containing protein [Chelatococcus sp. HY11]MBX3541014.1 PRC-barrel domain-containing protein [Chelatococcus sp.]MBX3542031.1 PRC-barrel domain-containing protein [Chelatococcus sp.]MCO5074076.1 PRC-barrel domain-containing protein [Chelatococcus sp.]
MTQIFKRQWRAKLKITGPVAAVLLPLLGLTAFAQTKPQEPPQPGGAGGPLSKLEFVTAQKQGEWRATEFDGLDVYDVNGEEIGEIEEVLVNSSGQMTTVVLKIGGFLGMGTSLVGVPFSAIQWNTQATSGDQPSAPSATSDPPASPQGSQARSAADAMVATGGIPRRPTLPLTKGDLVHSPPPTFNYAGRALPTPSTSSKPDSNTSGNRLEPQPKAQ